MADRLRHITLVIIALNGVVVLCSTFALIGSQAIYPLLFRGQSLTPEEQALVDYLNPFQFPGKLTAPVVCVAFAVIVAGVLLEIAIARILIGETKASEG